MAEPFEQQVADFISLGVRHLLSCAVRGPSPGGDYLALCNCGRDEALALRVAAAIEAAADKAWHHHVENDRWTAKDAALRALRGGDV